MFEKFIKKIAEKYISKAAISGYNLAKKEAEDNRRIDFDYQVTNAIGKKIIYCPNEWCDPLFAVVTGLSDITNSSTPMLTCKNVITDEESFVSLGTFHYADELLTLTILKLNPFERWNMTISKLAHMRNMWQKYYPHKKELTDSMILEDKLREVGFLFKHQATSDWIQDCVFNQKYLNYDFTIGKVDPIVSVTDKTSGNRIQWLTFDSFKEIKEFKSIIGL